MVSKSPKKGSSPYKWPKWLWKWGGTNHLQVLGWSSKWKQKICHSCKPTTPSSVEVAEVFDGITLEERGKVLTRLRNDKNQLEVGWVITAIGWGYSPPTNSEIIISSFLWRDHFKPSLFTVSGPGIPPNNRGHTKKIPLKAIQRGYSCQNVLPQCHLPPRNHAIFRGIQ